MDEADFVFRADSSSPQVKAILKRKKEYLSQLQISIKEVSKKEELARKRAREELPSDDELPTTSRNANLGGSTGGHKRQHSGKRRKGKGRKEVVEEEIVVPRITMHSIPLFLALFCYVVCCQMLILVSSEYPQIPAVSINQILETNEASYRPRKMRILCRVRDYHPRNIADFAVAWCNLCKNT